MMMIRRLYDDDDAGRYDVDDETGVHDHGQQPIIKRIRFKMTPPLRNTKMGTRVRAGACLHALCADNQTIISR